MNDPIRDTLGNVNLFLDSIFQGLAQKGITVTGLELDHICYRTETQDEYELKKMEMDLIGQKLIESDVGGRAIATYQLTTPIQYKYRYIELVELPSPKAGSPYTSGLEHAEFVIPQGFKMFQAQNPGVHFNRRALSKSINPDISIKLGPYSAKFHEQSLYTIIQAELSA